jgi:hypothetical protein
MVRVRAMVLGRLGWNPSPYPRVVCSILTTAPYLRAGVQLPGPLSFVITAVLAALDRVQSPKITHLSDAPGSRGLLRWRRCTTRRG